MRVWPWVELLLLCPHTSASADVFGDALVEVADESEQLASTIQSQHVHKRATKARSHRRTDESIASKVPERQLIEDEPPDESIASRVPERQLIEDIEQEASTDPEDVLHLPSLDDMMGEDYGMGGSGDSLDEDDITLEQEVAHALESEPLNVKQLLEQTKSSGQSTLNQVSDDQLVEMMHTALRTPKEQQEMSILLGQRKRRGEHSVQMQPSRPGICRGPK